MSNNTQSPEPRILDYGPQRLIGLGRVCKSFQDCHNVWADENGWLGSHPEWQGFCDGNPDGCGCVERPSFELYPPGFDGSGGLFIYVPLRAC